MEIPNSTTVDEGQKVRSLIEIILEILMYVCVYEYALQSEELGAEGQTPACVTDLYPLDACNEIGCHLQVIGIHTYKYALGTQRGTSLVSPTNTDLLLF